MERKILSFLIIGFICLDIFSQDLIHSQENSLMPVGAYYYPEHWSEKQWERDIKRIAELGFGFTHFAEFAWSRLEPKEGQFDFTWLDRCVALADKYGLKVIMCTPSPTPPAWLTEKHPEILIVTEDGFQVKHGMRLNVNGMNPIYQYYVKRIIEKMAEHYGNSSVICGWQLDNEPHYEGLYDYSPFVKGQFQRWLKNKYTTIENLNKAWGAAFWSYEFNDFKQIDLPNPKEHNNNPHAKIDFKRYSADAIAAALRFQSEVLRNKISSKQWITTNFAYYKFLPSVDLFRSRQDLDFASHTMYLLSTSLDYPKGNLANRLGSGMELSFSSELARSIKGYTGIMELQPGQIDWGAWNSQPLPGAVRMWIWHSFGLGDKFVCTYRFRQPLFGAEQFHKGIMEPDGVTLSPGGEEFVTAIKEIKKLSLEAERKSEIPIELQSRSTAFLWKQDNLMSLETVKLTQQWDTWEHYYTYYQKLKTMGVPVTFIQESDNFDVIKYPFMIAPAYEMVDNKLILKWKKYVEDGGHLILTTRSGMKDNNSHLWEAPLQQPIRELIGAKVDCFDQLSPDEEANVFFDGGDYTWNVWGDQLSPFPGTKIWGIYSDQFYKGKPCIIKKGLGKGAVYYIGVISKNKDLEKRILRKIYQENNAIILDLPDYFFVEYRDGYWVAVNYTSEAVNAPIKDRDIIVLGTKLVPPGGVVVWK